MKKFITTIIMLLALVLTSASVLASGVILGPYWYNCNDVADWDDYDFSTCANDDSTWSTHTTMNVGEVKAVGLGVQSSHNPVNVKMEWREASSSTWHTFYNANVNTALHTYAPFVADTISFSTSGAKVIRVSVTPNGQSTQTFTMTASVEGVNDCPEIVAIPNQYVDEGDLVQFDVNAIDADDSYLQFTSTPLPLDATFTRIDGNSYRFRWQTDSSDSGTHPITFTVSDTTCTDDEYVAIVVGNVNRPPEFTIPVPDLHTPEDMYPIFNPVNLDNYATDLDGTALTYTLLNETNSALIDCYLTGPRNHNFMCYTPAANQTGMSTITVRASDGSLTDTDTFNVIVDPVNDGPSLAPIADISVCEGDWVVITAEATDIDGPSLFFSIDSLLFSQSLNQFVWHTGSGDEGEYDFTVTVSDGFATDSEDVHVTVRDCIGSHAPRAAFNWTPANPELCQQAVMVTFDGTSSYDPDGDDLIYSWDFNDDGITDATGAIVSYGFVAVGDYDVTLTVTDGVYSDSLTQTVRIYECTSGNQYPVAEFTWDPEPAYVGQIVHFNASQSYDPDGDALTYYWDFDDNGITDATGMLVDHVFDAAGNYPVMLTVSDGSLADDVTHIVHIIVPELNITNLVCFDTVVIGHEQACTVSVESQLGVETGAHVELFYECTDEYIGDCISAGITGSCVIDYTATELGIFT
ncbi:MAG: PKD domain-containing protein, partial [Nanoarchaeota archaeon]|nr:PKD domain-containing protein [Nanoarchaeota archaeon]